MSSFTVGPTTPGNSTGAYSGLTATQVTMPQDGVLQSVSINWFSNAGGNFILGVYADNAGVPGALLATTAPAVSVVGLQTLPTTTNPAMLSGQSYWITVQTQTGIGGYFDTGGLGAFFSSQTWTGALPTNWGGASTGAFTFSLFATLNTGSPPKTFPFTVADTSTVTFLRFQGAAIVKRFPVIVADTSTVVLGFHQLASSFTIGPTTPDSNTGAYTGMGATQYTASQSGTLQSLSAIWFSNAGGLFLLGLYADNAGSPGALLATTAVATSVIGTQTLPTTTHPVILSGQKYWIAVQTQTAIGGYYSTTGVAAVNSAAWTGALPDPWTPGSTGLSFTFDFFATATPGIAGFPMRIADTSTVSALNFRGAPIRFPLTVNDTSTVAIGFHGSTPLTVRYIKPSGTGDGTSWTNAAGIGLVNSVGAADWCFYLAGGTYPPQNFTASGSSPSHPVYVRRASATDPLCVAGAGWSPAFDTQVIITQGVNLPAYFALDGNKWTPPGLPSVFGIQITYVSGGGKGIDTPDPQGRGGNTIRNVEVIGPGMNVSQSEYDLIFLAKDSLVSGCSLHDSDALLKSWAGISNVTLEYCWLYNVSSDIVHTHDPFSSPHPDIWYNSSGVVGLTVRYNVIANIVSEGFFFDNNNGIAGSNHLFYGNLMFQGDTQGDVAGGWGSNPFEIQNGFTLGSVFFYNNTFVDFNKDNYLGNGSATIDAVSRFKNNLWIGCDSGDIPLANMSFNGFTHDPGGGTNNQINAASPFAGPYNPSVGFSNSGTPPGTRVYPGSPGADPPGYNPSLYLNNFKLAIGSWALGKGTSVPPYNTDMFGNTGLNLGAFQTAGAAPPPPILRFPMTIADTSTVVLGFHGMIPRRFPLIITDTSTVNFSFHGLVIHFQLAVNDVSRVLTLGFSPNAIQHFPISIDDISHVATMGFQINSPIQPPGPFPPQPIPPRQGPGGKLIVPPYAGINQPTQVLTNAETEAREADMEDGPRVMPPNTDSTLPPFQTTDDFG